MADCKSEFIRDIYSRQGSFCISTIFSQSRRLLHSHDFFADKSAPTKQVIFIADKSAPTKAAIFCLFVVRANLFATFSAVKATLASPRFFSRTSPLLQKRGIFMGQVRSYKSVATRLLQPNRIPMWVITNALNQACANWVGDNVSCNIDNIFIFANGVIVVSCLPNGLANRLRGFGFYAFYKPA